MKKINDNGFTLVELLGVFAILGIIMLVAIPNVMGILDRNKKNTFVEHAKQMIALTEYKMSSDTTIEKVASGKVVIFKLSFLNTDDITTSANGIEYDKEDSYVVVYNKSGAGLQYYVRLVEVTTKKGLELISQSDLNHSNAIQQVKESCEQYSLTSSISLPNGGGTRSIQRIYQ